MPRWLAAILLLVLLPAPAAADERAFEAALGDFRKLHRAEMRRSGIAGSSFYVVRDGRTVAADHLGEQDSDARVPVDSGTIYHWASITKTMTGIAIMQLRDRGLLRLDDPIVRYVPELAAVHNPYGDTGAITLRQLMSHSAGFRGGTWPWRDREWQPFEPRSWAQLEAMLPYTRVEFRAGTRFGYSNPGIVYLGQVIERLSGEDFEIYVDKNILKPLAMHSSYFDRTPPHLLRHRSHSYHIRGGRRVAAPFDVDTGVTVSNGGLNAPMPDMARYVAFLLGDPARAAEYDLVLKRASLEEMWRPQIAAGADFTQGRMARTTQSGLSFFVDRGGESASSAIMATRTASAPISASAPTSASALSSPSTPRPAASATTLPTATPPNPGSRLRPTACARRSRNRARRGGLKTHRRANVQRSGQ